MKIKLLTSAIIDLKNAYNFYEQQALGLGQYCLNSLSSEIDSLLIYAGIHEKHWGFYRLLAKRFPYAVYYKLENSLVLVYRVLDLRQDPKKTKLSLKPR